LCLQKNNIMNSKIKEKLSEVLDKCEREKYPNICKKLNFKEGKEYVINAVYNRLNDFPEWDLGTAMTDLELFLRGAENE
jgi:hypothetical protein